MRPPIVMAKPNYPPHVCLNCGMQDSRLWFVDLGLDLDMYFNPLLNGTIYLCNACWDSIVRDVTKLSQVFLNQTLPWDSGTYAEPTYKNETPLEGFIEEPDAIEQSEPVVEDNPDTPVGIEGGFTFGTGDGIPSEPTASADPTTSEHDPTVDDGDPDAELPAATNGVQEFQSFFGKP